MSQAKANSQNIYDKVTVMDVRIRNLEPGSGKFEKRILILALRIMTLHLEYVCVCRFSCIHIVSEFIMS